MPEYTTDDIRNVALVGHGGAGKTTLAEALLAYAGVIGAPGSVVNGTSVCDFDPQEKEHQHSLYTAVVHFDHGSRHMNLVDTPATPTSSAGRCRSSRRWRPRRSWWTRGRGFRWSPGA